MNRLTQSDVRETIWDDGELVFARLTSTSGAQPVLTLRPAATQPTRSSLGGSSMRTRCATSLDRAWATVPRRLVTDEGRLTLVMDDPGGDLLARHLGRPWPLAAFLRVAGGLARALRKLHERGIVHKDVKPSHVLFDATSGDVWLTGFGIAASIPLEGAAPHAPDEVEGTLAYMPPEQTGRMNRRLDARADLYALGVTFYELLSGSLPFSASTPLEWIHSHVARTPPPLPPAVPAPVAAIVTKLLAKTADERYQTAAGVEADLRRCQEELLRHRQRSLRSRWASTSGPTGSSSPGASTAGARRAKSCARPTIESPSAAPSSCSCPATPAWASPRSSTS